MPTYVVGDVHGCGEALHALLEQCGFDADRDRLWLVGDLVNRGPRSLEVLRWARRTAERMVERMVAVLGNHDLHLVSRHAGVAERRSRDTFNAVLDAPDVDRLVSWLRWRPLIHREDDHLLVHAGLLPSWTPGEAVRRGREAEALLRSEGGPRRLLAKAEPGIDDDDPASPRAALTALTRLRTCTVEGRPCHFSGPPEAAPSGCLPWFRVPGRRSTGVTVLCGHWAALGLHREPGVVALDSGAAWGGSLSALRLDDGLIFQQPVTETARPWTAPG